MPKPGRPSATRRAAWTASTLKAGMRASAASSAASSSSWLRWSMASAISTRDLATARRRPMDVVERVVLAQRALRAAVLEEMLELRPGRIFRRAEQPRHGEGAAGIGPGRAGRDASSPLQPAAQEAGHEGVAGAEHVVDFDREALADDAGFEVVGDRPVIDDAAHGAALQHDRRAGERANGLQRSEHVVGARRDHDLLFGADDQVAVGQHRLAAARTPPSDFT